MIGKFKLNTCDAKQFIFLTAQRNKYQSYFFSFQGPQGPLVLPRLVCPSVHSSDRSCLFIHIVPLTSVTPVTPVTSLTTLTNVAPVTLLHLITSFYTSGYTLLHPCRRLFINDVLGGPRLPPPPCLHVLQIIIKKKQAS